MGAMAWMSAQAQGDMMQGDPEAVDPRRNSGHQVVPKASTGSWAGTLPSCSVHFAFGPDVTKSCPHVEVAGGPGDTGSPRLLSGYIGKMAGQWGGQLQPNLPAQPALPAQPCAPILTRPGGPGCRVGEAQDGVGSPGSLLTPLSWGQPHTTAAISEEELTSGTTAT